MVSRAAGQALGKLASNLRNPRWYAAQAAETSVSIFVINPFGKEVAAYLKKHLLHEEQDQKIGEVYHCADGHEYFHIGGKTYRHDASTDTWYKA